MFTVFCLLVPANNKNEVAQFKGNKEKDRDKLEQCILVDFPFYIFKFLRKRAWDYISEGKIYKYENFLIKPSLSTIEYETLFCH